MPSTSENKQGLSNGNKGTHPGSGINCNYCDGSCPTLRHLFLTMGGCSVFHVVEWQEAPRTRPILFEMASLGGSIARSRLDSPPPKEDVQFLHPSLVRAFANLRLLYLQLQHGAEHVLLPSSPRVPIALLPLMEEVAFLTLSPSW